MPIRRYAALVLGLLLWGTLGVSAPAPLRLVSDVWPPFTDVEGKPREAIELVKAALLRSKVQSRFTITTWTEAVKALESGKADGSPAVWKSAEREKYLLFSKPYLENRLLLVSRKGETVSFSAVDKLVGKRLALTKGYAYGDAVTKVAKVELVYLGSDAECLRAVLQKRADYLLLDALMVRHLFDFHEAKARELLAAGEEPIVRYPLHFALRKDYPRAAEIIADFDRNIERMRADGTYNVHLRVPWIRADVDGDGVQEFVGSKQTALKGGADPSTNQAGYPIFHPEGNFRAASRSPGYVIDGKSYNTWGDAVTGLERSGPTKPKGLYKYSTGFVLVEF